ncbi:MAG: hypothetical protein KDD45_02495, partial [Bdellovibrionales bacterium]|nr:hypothetical protein [Bdellovibrionales bacterium]
YSPEGPFIWVSPLYMPLSWGGMLISFGVLGDFLVKKTQSKIKGSLLAALAMGVYVPFYEYLAQHANWWFYLNAKGVGGVPYFIFIGEFLIGIPLALIIAKVKVVSFKEVTVWGVIVGLWIYISYWIAYKIQILIL